ncbi:hypothetical protein LEP1GSC050_1113 [Leptospira broomii serovar Hurstbridge str. 5399]|uniref:Uncharacterized protein n=1 Tax=Leptospira broomii serovar Hurstbridge str. 5399 TaxID=1049789 RepID=T0GJ29_9LEPT|nr:hypothetical protein [Leptospira broomii]EQA46824.1 hypothetical protein LEP1GSC050_1113 [Leptospira broomii serovar Hurstbridge str. 5399]
MLYIALALVLVGLLCFIYVSFQPGFKNRTVPSGSARMPNPIPRDRKIVTEAVTSAKKPVRTESSSHLDRVFAEERKIRPVTHASERREESNMIPEEEVWEEEIKTEPIPREESLRQREQPPEETVEIGIESREEEWSMEGILFLDLSGKLPYEGLKQKIRPEQLKGFRRIGKGRVREIPGGFAFHALNSEFSYKLDEVEKVIFYDEGFALLPAKREFPTPIFLTKETERFKNYLEHTSKM